MALPSSGPISLAMIAAEFGGVAPHSLSEYYRAGAWVRNIAANAAVPTAGPIALSNFYSARGGVTLNANYNLLDDEVSGYNTMGIRLLSNGQLQTNVGGAGYTTLHNWLLSTSNTSAFYDVMFGTPSLDGGISTTGSFGVWLNLASNREVTFSFSGSISSGNNVAGFSGVSLRDVDGVTYIAGSPLQVAWFNNS